MDSNYIFLKEAFPNLFKSIREMEIHSNNYSLQTREAISLLEKMLKQFVFKIEAFEKENYNKLYCAINEIPKRMELDSSIVDTMHRLRRKGNKAKHEDHTITKLELEDTLSDFFEFTKWWYAQKTGIKIQAPYVKEDGLTDYLKLKAVSIEDCEFNYTDIAECDSFFRT
ncbi:MAG: DUF4145 domain-containing protein [Carnobacterium sp.]|uniref:hypothetical protein n=1 Tax=Carnobacterium sp. TaxID=48221 RepID=UPI003C753CBF